MLLATCSLCTKTCDTQTCCCCRAIARGAVAALAFCHERGVAHGSLGAASFLLSTFDDRRAAELIVKLDNFGFARMLHRPHAPDGEADEGASLSRRPRVSKGVYGARSICSPSPARGCDQATPGIIPEECERWAWHCAHGIWVLRSQQAAAFHLTLVITSAETGPR